MFSVFVEIILEVLFYTVYYWAIDLIYYIFDWTLSGNDPRNRKLAFSESFIKQHYSDKYKEDSYR